MEVVGAAPDPLVAREMIQHAQSRRAHAGRRDAAHGRPRLPRKADAPAADAGGDGVDADRARLPRPRCARWSWARSTSSPSRSSTSSDGMRRATPPRSSRRSAAARARVRRCARRAAPPRRRRGARRLGIARQHREADHRSAPPPAAPRRSRELLPRCRPTAPAILITQHMPAASPARFAERLNSAVQASASRRPRTASGCCPATPTSRRAASTCW